MYQLRIKTKCGKQYTLKEKVNGESTLAELRIAVKDLTDIRPERQKILTGFPPKAVTLEDHSSLTAVGIRNNEVLIVEDVPLLATHPKVVEVKKPVQESLSPRRQSSEPPAKLPRNGIKDGILLKKIVPSDNSCLFASIYYLVNGGELDSDYHVELRKIVASVISSRPEQYTEALLEKTNKDYCKWILKETSWGGAIELSILCDYYGMEIVAIDAKTGLLNRFGEDKQYENRMVVMYDGIHYDPVYMETFDGGILTVFPTSDDSILLQAKELADEAKNSGQYTDTKAFKLECKQCGTLIQGEDDALAHAKSTGHTKFDEVKNN